LKILFFSDHGPYNSTFIRQDVEKISKHHNALYICTISDKTYSNKTINTKLIKYPSKSLKSKIRWRLEKTNYFFNWRSKKFAKEIGKQIALFDPDIIHCQFAYEAVKLLQNFETEKPIIINFRGYGASSKLKNKIYVKWLKEILRKKNIYPIYVSNSLKKNLEKKGIKTANDGIILYTGIDINKFKRKNYNNRGIINFIQVGNFNEKKGQYYTIKAFKKLCQNNPDLNLKLTFVGEGKNFIVCKRLTKSLDLDKKIFFLGNQNHNVIINLLDDSHIFVHHSITPPNGCQEGIPNSILEAMSMEMPILSSYHSGIPEAVAHNVNGMLSKEKDLNTFSLQMKQILNWGYKIDNREKVIEKFQLSKHLEKLNNFYLNIIKKSSN
tara:strand:- start:5124 stop:6266 length:1143 start_codon:yes stop_codon:yes gene_type:complete